MHEMKQYLSNGRFKNADHQAAVNSKSSRLSVATFLNPAPNAIVYPLKVREGEKPVMEEAITFMEMYKRKMSNDLELARLMKIDNQQKKLQQEEEEEEAIHKSKLLLEKDNKNNNKVVKSSCKSLEEILA